MFSFELNLADFNLRSSDVSLRGDVTFRFGLGFIAFLFNMLLYVKVGLHNICLRTKTLYVLFSHNFFAMIG